MFVVGSMILFGGLYYRKQIVYNSIYAYVILENNIKIINNKYFRKHITYSNYKLWSIIEIFNTNFTKKRYKIVKNCENNLNPIYTSIDFNSPKLFLSIELLIGCKSYDLTKDINLFIIKNNDLILNYELLVILNKFLDLQLEITEDNYTWKLLDNGFNVYEGTELLFKIDENYFLTFIN